MILVTLGPGLPPLPRPVMIPRGVELAPGHGLVDAYCLATIATPVTLVTVAHQARIESGRDGGSRSSGEFLDRHADQTVRHDHGPGLDTCPDSVV